MDQVKWGTFTWARGFQVGNPLKSLDELAARGGQDLEHAFMILANQNTEEADFRAEQLLRKYT